MCKNQDDKKLDYDTFKWTIGGILTAGTLVLGWVVSELRAMRQELLTVDNKHTLSMSDAVKENTRSRARVYTVIDEIKTNVHKVETTLLREMATKEDLREMKEALLDAIHGNRGSA